MKPKNVKLQSIFATYFIIFLLICNQALSAASESYTLDNGMDIILMEKHGSPMIASIIFVKSGSKYESQFENGITHFLEHFLFDGTSSLSREELDHSIRDLGGYLNAFTRKELTAYLVLVPKQYIDYGLTVQTDMLFHSLIPEEELAKERKVVIEEINRSLDSPDYPAYTFFNNIAYTNTPYNRPVLGYKAFIENISRDAIVDYWKKAYTPENMITLIIGDFETASMKEKIEQILGTVDKSAYSSYQITDSSLPAAEPKSDEITFVYEPISGQTIIDTTADVQQTYINFSFNAPHHSDSLYMAADLLSQYLAMDDVSPLMKALTQGATPIATYAGFSLETFSEFSRFEVSVITDKAENSEKIIEIILNELNNISSFNADGEVLKGIKTSNKCSEIYNADKLHYYGFMIAPMMMTTGWDFIQSYSERLNKVSWTDCRNAAELFLKNSNYIATVVKPKAQGQTGYEIVSISAEEVISHFDSVKFPQYNLADIPKVKYPSTDSVDFIIVDNSEYFSEELANGMKVIIKTRPDSKVFAMNIIGKNRSANEPEGKTGITDFVNRCIEKGTVTRSSFELTRDLASIGANLTLYDNPWIPYDDRYTSRSYTFLKFETIDEFAQKGFHLFSEMILHPAFDSVEVENVRNSMISVLGRNSNSPGKVASNLFYRTLFNNNSFSNPIMGTAKSIAQITVDDLIEHHARFYAPENMIMSIVSNQPASEVMNWVESQFGRLVKSGKEYAFASAPEPVFEIKSEHQELDKEQISIILGASLPGAHSDDVAAIKIATSILSTRLYLNLREKQGLAYSVGAGSRIDNEFGWYYCSIGTGYENYQKAIDGIILQIEKLKYDGPNQDEINKARNQFWGRLMSSKLSNINQAYYLGLDAFYGRSVKYDIEFLKKLAEIDIPKVREIFSKYFNTDAYVLATAGKKE